jgi:hypothetical protein
VPISRTSQSHLAIMHRQDRNNANNIFGGHLLRLAAELAYSTAVLHAGRHCEAVAMSDVAFKQPVPIGCVLEMRAKVRLAAMRVLAAADDDIMMWHYEATSCMLVLQQLGCMQRHPVCLHNRHAPSCYTMRLHVVVGFLHCVDAALLLSQLAAAVLPVRHGRDACKVIRQLSELSCRKLCCLCGRAVGCFLHYTFAALLLPQLAAACLACAVAGVHGRPPDAVVCWMSASCSVSCGPAAPPPACP